MNDSCKKRSREEANNIPEDDEIDSAPTAFQRSKKILRSPEERKLRQERELREENKVIQQDKTNETEEQSKMEELKTMMKEMMETVMIEIRSSNEELKKDILELKSEMKRKEEEWDKEKSMLLNRLSQIEERVENEEKRKKKNNIIIKGAQIDVTSINRSVEDFLRKELEVETKINTAYKLESKTTTEMIVVQMESWEKKKEVMQTKNKLKNTKIYIDNDLTKKEREIQMEIRKIAFEEKKKGKRTKISYQALKVNDEVYKWDKKEYGLVLNSYNTRQKN